MNLLMIRVGIITHGVAAQVLADRFQVPNVLFLILIGVAVGPEGIGLVTKDKFAGALSTIVGLSLVDHEPREAGIDSEQPQAPN